MDETKDSENTPKRAGAITILPEHLLVFSQQAPFQYTVESTPEKTPPETEEEVVLDPNDTLNDDCSIRIERTFPNCDLPFAFDLYNSALYAHLQKVGEMTHEPDMAFSEKTFMYLDPIIRHMSSYTSTHFFQHIKSLYDVMQDGVLSAMQRWLLQSLVNKGFVLAKAANHLGFNAPVLNIDTLGKTSPYYVAGDTAREELTSSAVNLGKIYHDNIEHLLIDWSQNCSHDHYHYLGHLYRERYSDTNEIIQWAKPKV